eukprot:6364788-Pyramimonas_sp.AAC.1
MPSDGPRRSQSCPRKKSSSSSEGAPDQTPRVLGASLTASGGSQTPQGFSRRPLQSHRSVPPRLPTPRPSLDSLPRRLPRKHRRRQDGGGKTQGGRTEE